MQEDYLAILRLVSLCLNGGDTKNIDTEEWQNSYAELMDQAIVPIMAGAIGAEKFGSHSIDAMGVFCVNLKYYHLILAEQDQISSILKANGISFAILKGTSAAIYYKNPEHRTMGDIDLIIESSRFHEAIKLLEEANYKIFSTLEENPRHMVLISPSGIHIEPHIKFSSSNNEEYNKILDDMIAKGLKSVRVVEISGHEVNVLPELENGIVLLSHINQHLSAGLGLRQIIDWKFYVENVLTDEFWKSSFESKASKVRLLKLAKVVTCMCKKYLGLRSDATWYMEEIDSELVDELAEYIMSHGNFGHKDSATSRTVSIVRVFRNPINGLKTAQRCGLINWKATKKYPWLRPFAWIYQLGRWISHGIKQGVKVSKLSEISEKERKESEFLQRLEVTRM